MLNFCALKLMGLKCGLGLECVVKKKGGQSQRGRGKKTRERRAPERRGEERLPFYKMLFIMHCYVNFEGTWPMTLTVKGSKLIVVDFQRWTLSLVIVGISFRSTSCISAPTF